MTWLLCAVVAATFASQASSPESLAIVEGRVVLSATGEPVRKASVFLGSYHEDGSSEFVATTDEAGHFRFADVRPGSYRLTADKSGYLPGGYGQLQQKDSDSPLKVSAGDHFQDIVLRLFPAAIVSGQVLDRDGDPLPGYQVLLWEKSGPRRSPVTRTSDQTTADRDGQYRFGGLMPGTYYVSAEPPDAAVAARQVLVDSAGKPVNLHDYRTFFPSVITLTAAQSIHLLSGDEQEGVDIRVQRGPVLSVAGKITGMTGQSSEYRVSASVAIGDASSAKEGQLSADGSFVIADLPPGEHHVTLLRDSMYGFQTVGSAEVELADQNITGVTITPFEPAQLRVRVTLEDEGKPLTSGSVFLDPIDANANPHASQYQFTPDNGTYVLNGVSPGRYLVGSTNVGHCFLKSMKSNGQEIEPETLEVRSGAHLNLVLTYSKHLATITGDVTAPHDRPGRPVHIILVPQRESPLNRAWNTKVDQFLHFSIEGRDPGKYIAFAAEEGDIELWDDPDFLRVMRPDGTAIELHENEHATVKLKLITIEATDRVRSQLGF